LAVVPLLVALLGSGFLFRASMVAGGAVMVMLVPYLAALSSARRGEIRVSDAGGLRFVPRPGALGWPFAIAFAGLTAGILAVASLIDDQEFGLLPRTVWLVLLTGVLSAIWLGQSLWSLRVPLGLRVSAWGLEGVRGSKAVSLPWNYLAKAEAAPGRSGAVLRLTQEDGSSVVIAPQYLGSDPNVVAAIIEHYRAHPEDDDALADATDAVRRVEAGQS
jgi:hypothetical protein